MKRLASAIAAIALIGTPAFAADIARKMPVKAPPPPPAPVYSWNGFYVGGNIGGGWSDRNVSLTPNDSDTADIIAVLPAQPFKTNGVLGGVQLGYNWQFQPNWLLGFETDFDWSNLRGSSTVSGLFGGTETVTSTTSEHVNWFGTLRGRLGWLPWQNLLVYGTGGFAYGGVKHIGSIANSSSIGFASIGGLSCPAFATCLAGTSTSTATGWTAGGGVEWALWQNWSLKGEYLYVSLDSKSVTEVALDGSGSSLNANFGRANFNVVRAGLNYHF